MKGEEGDPQRQSETRQRKAGAGGQHAVERADDEVGIFEHAKQRQIQTDGDGRRRAPGVIIRADDQRGAIIQAICPSSRMTNRVRPTHRKAARAKPEIHSSPQYRARRSKR
jgi:hypothetical protein